MKFSIWMKKTAKKLRKAWGKHGYVCDGCGAEVFEYPYRRLCEECKRKMCRPDRTCEKCGRETRAQGICLDCKQKMPKFTRGFSPFVYLGESASFINRVKNGNPRLAWYFGEQMATCFALKSGIKADTPLLIVPVPLTQKRQEERGYNQAERLSEGLEEALKALGFTVTLDVEVLEKKRDTAMQKGMGREERAENVEGAYHVHKRKACRGKVVILVDDIMTTGATASECAARLFGAGAQDVFFLAATALAERE